MPNIAIVWDFDGTLTPHDSTTIAAGVLGADTEKFWDEIHELKGDGDKGLEWRHILASDAPVWMYALSRIAFANKIPLNAQFFEHFVKPNIELYPKVVPFLQSLRDLDQSELFKSVDLHIRHFIVSAGLQDLVSLMFPPGLIEWTFGCRYRVNAFEGDAEQPESIPVFCMDETMKTRSLFEISKGSFSEEKNAVNRRVPLENRWAQFCDIIYIGDGDTDVPSLSLVRSQGGVGIAVYNPDVPSEKIREKLRLMCLEKRADLITPAKFEPHAELFEFISARCKQIALRHRAERSI